jgi:hypothetical protein
MKSVILVIVVGFSLVGCANIHESGVASAQDTGEVKVNVNITCYPNAKLYPAMNRLKYTPVIGGVSSDGEAAFSVWVNPDSKVMVLSTAGDMSCIMANAVGFHVIEQTKRGTL